MYFFISPSILSSQSKISFSGIISDTLDNPLAYANILAFPEQQSQKTFFGISDKKGKFNVELLPNIRYEIKISFLGFSEITYNFYSTKSISKNFKLLPATNELDEVILNYKIPIVVKKDTIIYNAEAFATGKERKLRELLKRLPGIEVDRDGNVTSRGKKITKVLVENDIFFTGDGKLAVNNIPASVVEEIEVLDNYNEIAFLKGLVETDDVALNIKLKEDKKKFVFGDIELGLGIQDRYLLHPSLFYYGPKTNVNLIGDINNTGTNFFSLKDYSDYKGGYSRLISENKTYYSTPGSDFSAFLRDEDFKSDSHSFAGLSYKQSISSKSDFKNFIIVSDNRREIETINNYQYIDFNNSLQERRTLSSSLDNLYIINKSDFNYKPNINENLLINSVFKFSNSDNFTSINTLSLNDNNSFINLRKLDNIEFNQNIEYNNKINRKHTISSQGNLQYSNRTPKNTLISDVPFLENFFSFLDDETFNITQRVRKKDFSFDFVVKDYWALNNSNHVYTSLGGNKIRENYSSSEEQRLSNGSFNSFVIDGFGNDIEYDYFDFYAGLEYKFLLGLFTFKSGLFYHDYQWKNVQFGQEIIKRTDVVLPKLDVKVDINSAEKISFKYRNKLIFPNGEQLSSRRRLTSFNSIIIGNPLLSNGRSHSLLFNYNKSKFLKGQFFDTFLLYNIWKKGIKSLTELDGINQLNTRVILNQPEENLFAGLNFSNKINSIKYTLRASGSYSEFFQLVNSSSLKNISRRLSLKGKIETSFEKGPNFEIGYSNSPTNYQTNFSSVTFNQQEFNAGVNWLFWKDFQLNADYSRQVYKSNSGVSELFELSNASLYYSKEDSPFAFEINARNLFDVKVKRENSFKEYLISDRFVLIFPRTILFKISYKI